MLLKIWLNVPNVLARIVVLVTMIFFCVMVRSKQVIKSILIYSGIPVFLTLNFSNLPIIRTMASFPWICFSQTLLFYPCFFELAIFRDSRYFEPILPPMEEIYNKFTFVFSTHRKVLLSNFHLNGHTSGFYSQTQKVEAPSITQ